MKLNTRPRVTVVCLIMLVAVLAVIHFTTRVKVPAGTIAVESNGATCYLALSNLTTAHITGEITNGRGERSTIDGEGIWLRDLLTASGVDVPNRVTAIAGDEYSAVIERDELDRGVKVCLLVENGKGRLVVFGDPNSKRNVAGLIRLVIE